MKSLLLVFLIAAASAQNCLDSADRLINGRCFKFVSQQLSYQDARNWCHYNNPVTYSYLATVSDTTTSNFLASYARTIFNTNEGSFWIGLNKYNTSSRFQWDDGTPVSWTNFQEPKSMNYVAESMINGKWSTYGSDSKFNFVCSYDPNGSPTRGTTENLTDKPTTNWMTTNEATPTPTELGCAPETSHTFFYAYSTDFTFTQIQQVFESSRPFFGSTRNIAYANVRFDMKSEEEILYHQDVNSLNASIWSHLPDPSMGYLDNSTGSDMFNVIRKFLKNTQYLCGSTIFITAKRYPNEIELDDLITELRENHVFVYIIATDSPSGGNNPSAMFDVSTKTNGYCVFSDDNLLDGFYNVLFWMSGAFSEGQIVAQKFLVSGIGCKTIPFKIIYETPSQQADFHIIFQDHKNDGSLKSLNYTVTDASGNNLRSDGGRGSENTCTAYFDFVDVNNAVDYFLTVDYEYEVGRQEVLEIRIYATSYIPDDWLPFDN